MTETDASLTGEGRAVIRRAVRLDCAVQSRFWAGALPFIATDLSPRGVWLDTDFPLASGELVGLGMVPPRWPSASPIALRARVAHAVLGRRRGDRGRAGMGLEFCDLSALDAGLMGLVLRGLPPPLPGAHRAPAARRASAARVGDAAPAVDALSFVALGGLLTGSRIVAPPPAGRGVVIPFPRLRTHHVAPASPHAGRWLRLHPPQTA